MYISLISQLVTPEDYVKYAYLTDIASASTMAYKCKLKLKIDYARPTYSQLYLSVNMQKSKTVFAWFKRGRASVVVDSNSKLER